MSAWRAMARFGFTAAVCFAFLAEFGTARVGRHGVTHVWPIHSYYVAPLLMMLLAYFCAIVAIVAVVGWLVEG